MEVYLAHPAGEREGPFSIDQLNQDLAAGKYGSEDYWAWHEGLDEFVPLYDVKGIIKVSTPAVSNMTVAEGENLHASQDTTVPGIASVPASHDADVPGRASVLASQDATSSESDSDPASPDISTPALTNASELPEEPGSSEEPSPQDVQEEVPELGAHEQTATMPVGDCPETLPSSPVANPEPLDFATENPFCVEAARTDHPEPTDTPPVSQLPAEPETEPPAVPSDEGIEGGWLARDSVIEDEPAPDYAEAPAQPTEPSSANEMSHLPGIDAGEPDANAETPTAILARLKKNLFQTPEPSNGVTCYFNAARATTPQASEAGVTNLGNEWAPSDGAQPLTRQPSGPTEAPRPGSSAPAQEDPQVALLAQQYSSGMPFDALEQIFIFTTGDGPSVWSSPIVKRMLEAVVGEQLDRIRQTTPRDVIFNCDLSQLLKRNGAISDAVWNAMAIRVPSVVARAQQKLSCTCVRTFHLETGTVVALILYYNNQKLNPDATPPESAWRANRITFSASTASPGFPLSR